MVRNSVRERGQMNTVNDNKMAICVSVLTPWMHKQIRRIFRCFENYASATMKRSLR